MPRKRKPTPADVKAKRETIQAYFGKLRGHLARARKLIDQKQYLFEGILTLCCHIGSFAALRFPFLSDHHRDRQAYKAVVLKYSGKRAFYEKIDLLFLYQWPKSNFRNRGDYKDFQNYSDVKRILVSKFGDENAIQLKKRFVTQAAIMKHVLANPFSGLDKGNLARSLPLFSVGEQLYRYLRSFAVHNFRFPFLNRVNNRYVPNHIITPAVLFETAENILTNLEKECLQKAKFPDELRQKRK